MYLTAQILTKNNEQTIQAAIDSISPVASQILVGDLGSTDRTKEICKSLGVVWENCEGMNRARARNFLTDMHPSQFHMYLEPWEILTSGHNRLRKLKCNTMASIFANGSLSKEVRVWNTGRFHNPIFERLDEDGMSSDLVIYSAGGVHFEDAMRLLEEWKKEKPTSPQPYYYHACMLLSEGRYDEFIQMADHYLFIEKDRNSMSATMTRYYYAMIQLLYRKRARPALQNLNLCLCANPLMAEFWCLTGDVHYHLLKEFNKAREFYENAIILGSRRLSDSPWPMEVAKYSEYPQKMIASCDKIIESSFVYASMN